MKEQYAEQHQPTEDELAEHKAKCTQILCFALEEVKKLKEHFATFPVEQTDLESQRQVIGDLVLQLQNELSQLATEDKVQLRDVVSEVAQQFNELLDDIADQHRVGKPITITDGKNWEQSEAKVHQKIATLSDKALQITVYDLLSKCYNNIKNAISKLISKGQEYGGAFFKKEEKKVEGGSEVDHEHDKGQEKGGPQNQ